jgi:serine/threonine protein kinase
MIGKLDDATIPYLVHMVLKAEINPPQTKHLYIAPELSFSDYSRTTDVWALGIVFL